MNEEITGLGEVEDPAVRATKAHDLVGRYQLAVTELSRVRREALEELVSRGRTHGQLAEMLNVTRARVGQILSSGPRSERAFLGTGTLVVALGGKREAEKSAPGPVVAQEDLEAYNQLQELARTVGLDARYEVVQPPGIIDLNRDNLVVICGPRLSPMIGQLLASDRNVMFDRDDSGWYLVDRNSGTEYRSPLDKGQPSDYAYFGRLPRLDGRGGFLYIAGIHAAGAAGVVHYVSEHLAEIYREVKTKRFSTVIRCTFDETTRHVTESERVTRLYRADGV